MNRTTRALWLVVPCISAACGAPAHVARHPLADHAPHLAVELRETSLPVVDNLSVEHDDLVDWKTFAAPTGESLRGLRLTITFDGPPAPVIIVMLDETSTPLQTVMRPLDEPRVELEVTHTTERIYIGLWCLDDWVDYTLDVTPPTTRHESQP